MTPSDAALLIEKHAGSAIPGLGSESTPLQAMTLNRDLWCRVAGERLAEIGKLKEALDVMRVSRDEALAIATHAEAVNPSNDRLEAKLALTEIGRDEAFASRDRAVAERRRLDAELGDMISLCNDALECSRKATEERDSAISERDLAFIRRDQAVERLEAIRDPEREACGTTVAELNSSRAEIVELRNTLRSTYADRARIVAECARLEWGRDAAMNERDAARRACAELSRACAELSRVFQDRWAEDEAEEDEDDLDEADGDESDSGDDPESESALAAIADQFASFDARMKFFGARLAEVENKAMPGIRESPTPSLRPDASIPGLVALGGRIDRAEGRLDSVSDRVRELDRIGERHREESGRKLAMCEALVKNLTSQVETILARFDHPRLVELLRPANGEPASWTSNIRTKGEVPSR